MTGCARRRQAFLGFGDLNPGRFAPRCADPTCSLLRPTACSTPTVAAPSGVEQRRSFLPARAIGLLIFDPSLAGRLVFVTLPEATGQWDLAAGEPLQRGSSRMSPGRLGGPSLLLSGVLTDFSATCGDLLRAHLVSRDEGALCVSQDTGFPF